MPPVQTQNFFSYICVGHGAESRVRASFCRLFSICWRFGPCIFVQGASGTNYRLNNEREQYFPRPGQQVHIVAPDGWKRYPCNIHYRQYSCELTSFHLIGGLLGEHFADSSSKKGACKAQGNCQSYMNICIRSSCSLLRKRKTTKRPKHCYRDSVDILWPQHGTHVMGNSGT